MKPISRLLLEIIESDQPVEQQWADQPEQKDTLFAQAQQLQEDVKRGDQDAFLEMLRCLYILSGEIFRHPLDHQVWNFDDPTLYQIRYELERLWERTSDIHRSQIDWDTVPEQPAEFAQWLQNYCKHHAVTNHPIFKEMEQHLDRSDLHEYFRYLTSFDVAQTELYVRATVGLPDEMPRIEISKNYWDEMGLGEAEQCHTAWGARFIEALGESGEELPWYEEFCAIPALILERFVIAQYVSARRKNWLKVIGHLGATEIADPRINIHVVRLGRKFGFTDYELEYFIQHIKVDAIHSIDWLKKVVTPICEEDANNRFDIARGAELNLRTLQNGYDTVLHLLKQKRTAIGK